MRPIDALLILMVLIWGANFSVIKRAFTEIPPQPFNALRLIIAAAVFMIAIRWARGRARSAPGQVPSVLYTTHPVTPRDRVQIALLGLIGHFVYQICFVGGVAITSVSNAALIIGATPVVVALASALLGRERLGHLHWAGAALSVTGIYFVVGLGASFGGATLRGDLLVVASVFCWATYTLGAGQLIQRHSPLYITGTTMVVGAVPYVAIAMPQILNVDWLHVSTWAWGALVFSALFALNVAYLVWYMAVQEIGPSRTATYSNVVPIVAITVAAIWLREPLTLSKMAGAIAVLTGVFLTRLGAKPSAVPIEE
jgi:drug/metabolite transporter (DMT)-like permease